MYLLRASERFTASPPTDTSAHCIDDAYNHRLALAAARRRAVQLVMPLRLHNTEITTDLTAEQIAELHMTRDR